MRFGLTCVVIVNDTNNDDFDELMIAVVCVRVNVLKLWANGNSIIRNGVMNIECQKQTMNAMDENFF